VQRSLLYKKLALCRYFKVDDDNMGRVELVNHVLNGAIVSITTLLFLDWMSIEMNKALTGLVAFGSAGTLAFTLASKDLVTQLLSGFFLIFGNKMYVGDSVIFGDGTSGKVIKIGWLETLLRDSNNVITRVPNTLLSSQKVSNLSRIAQSQVKQTLRFGYTDALILPALLEDVKAEIRASCPTLITDKSRPFRAFWTDYKEDHLEVMIDTHFNIPPFSDDYWLNRQNVLIAITKAITKYNVQLLPAENASDSPVTSPRPIIVTSRGENRATVGNMSRDEDSSEPNGKNGAWKKS
jgi:small-conductance mechanosensitive channel